MTVISVMTCFLPGLSPVSSAFVVVSSSSRASFTVTSSRQEEGLGRNYQPLHLGPDTNNESVENDKPAATEQVMVVRDGYWQRFGLAVAENNGGVQMIAIVGFVIAFNNMNLGDIISSDIKASNAEMKASIVVLATETDASIEKLSTKTEVSIQKLEAIIEKLSDQKRSRHWPTLWQHKSGDE